MGTKKETVGKKDAARKLKLKKETVKDLSVKDGAAQAVKGAYIAPTVSCFGTGCTFRAC